MSLKNSLSQFFFCIGARATSKADVEMHLEHGRDMLARGQLQEALTHYHAAVGK